MGKMIMTAKFSWLPSTRRVTRTVGWGALLSLALMLIPSVVYGLGASIPNQNAQATARGNAFIATADNPSAIFYNPAAITQLDGARFEFGIHNLRVNSEFESLDGSTHAASKFQIASVPQSYFTYTPKDSQFSFGVGLYAPYGLGVSWPTNTPFNTLALQSKLLYVTFNPVVAWKILPNLSVAAGPTVNYAKVKFSQGIGLSAGDEFHFDGSGWDMGVTAGLLWKPFEKWSVGINYRSPTSIDFEGRSRLSPYAPGEDTSANLKFAQWVGGGVGYIPSKHWSFEAYVIWTDWDTLDTTTFKRPSGDIPFALNWESSFMTGLGGTRSFDNGWFVSAGYFFSENSTSESHFTPLVPDTNLHVGSAGFGYNGKRWSFALSGQIITGPWRVVEGTTPSPVSGQTADGKYKWFNQAVNFSMGYRF
jgi:long-chain fatty acid transport protein